MTTYKQLVEQMNQHMLADNVDRVALLNRVLDEIGHPETHYHVIHIAGTNGKGSTGAMLRETLVNAGFKVGHFASPAMRFLREQIKINNVMISETEFVLVYQQIVKRLPVTIKSQDISIFEWFVLITLQYFANQKIEWAVIEAGLGGQNDATNAITAPLLTVFTHIDYDHIKILGNTIKQIAYNKAGIIKPGSTIFVAPRQHPTALTVLKKQAQQKNAKAIIQVDSQVVKSNNHLGQGFNIDVRLQHGHFENLAFNLLGNFQLDNLATVGTVVDWLMTNNYLTNIEPFTKMMNQIEIPGRMQVIQQHPMVILDGAHNVDGAKRLVESLRDFEAGTKFIMILGFLKDKQYVQMAKLYETIATRIDVVAPDQDERALTAQQLADLFQQPVQQFSNAQLALSNAKKIADKHTVIVVTGSFYLIKELEED